MKLVTRFFPILAATLLFGAACNDSTSPSVSIQGTWQLHTLNGNNLPAPTGFGDFVNSETLTLSNDGSFDRVISFSGGTSTEQFGSYSVSGSQITFFDSQTGEQFTGSVSGNVLTVIAIDTDPSTGSQVTFTSVYQKS